jgi:hypothetical protein
MDNPIVWLSLGNVGGQKGQWQVLLRSECLSFEVSRVSSKSMAEYSMRQLMKALRGDSDVQSFVVAKARKIVDAMVKENANG